MAWTAENQRDYQREWSRKRRAGDAEYRRRDSENARRWQKTHPVEFSWSNTRKSALKRGHAWELDRDTFDALVSADCTYCGANPSPINGVDRIDNLHGYVAGNVATACEHCNYAKRKMTVEQFIAHARRIAAHNPEH